MKVRQKIYFQSRRGASLVEYTLLVALISLIGIGSLRSLGFTTRATFGDVRCRIVKDSADPDVICPIFKKACANGSLAACEYLDGY